MIDSKGAVGNISDYLYPVASCKATDFTGEKNANNAWIIKQNKEEKSPQSFKLCGDYGLNK